MNRTRSRSRRPRARHAAACVALLTACDSPAPAGGPHQLRATGLDGVTAVLEQQWAVHAPVARARHATRTEAGTARVSVLDAEGAVVHDAALLGALEVTTGRGVPGTWRVQVQLTGFRGDVDFALDAGAAAAPGLLRNGLTVALSMLAFVALLYGAFRIVVLRRGAAGTDERSIGCARELIMLAITAAGLLTVIVVVLSVVPLVESTRNAVIGLLGLVFTAILTLSSTTFVSNALAGFMLRALRPFRRGDWLRVGEQFGRVTERGIVHTQLQTEDRDYATLPNFYLITQPLTVIRRTGTYVAATLSLGYDHHHARVAELLERAALESGLSEPVEVRVLELGDFSVKYRVAALLGDDIKLLLVAESRLRRCILDVLHGAGIEIVSPTFMNQRRVRPDDHFVPDGGAVFPAPAPKQEAVDVIFDEAEQAAREEGGEGEASLESEIAEAEARLATLEGDARAAALADLADLRERSAERDVAQQQAVRDDG